MTTKTNLTLLANTPFTLPQRVGAMIVNAFQDNFWLHTINTAQKLAADENTTDDDWLVLLQKIQLHGKSAGVNAPVFVKDWGGWRTPLELACMEGTDHRVVWAMLGLGARITPVAQTALALIAKQHSQAPGAFKEQMDNLRHTIVLFSHNGADWTNPMAPSKWGNMVGDTRVRAQDELVQSLGVAAAQDLGVLVREMAEVLDVELPDLGGVSVGSLASDQTPGAAPSTPSTPRAPQNSGGSAKPRRRGR